MKNVFLPARPYQLYFEHRPDYLFAYVHSETISFDIARGYWVEILSMLHQRHYRRVLIEKDVRARLSAHDVFTLMSELAHSGYNAVSFAIFDHQYDVEKCTFEEMVGTNRGLKVKIFGDLPCTEQWLLGQSDGIVVDPNHFPHASVTPRAFAARG